MSLRIANWVAHSCIAALFARGSVAQEAAQPTDVPSATTVDQAMVNDGAQWIAWYLALPPDDLHTRIKNFAETQNPPPFDWLPAIEAALADPSPDARALAAAAIGSHHGAAMASANALRALLADPVSRVRFTAAFALVRVTQNPGEVLAVLEMLMHCDDADVRIDAARLLIGCDEEGTHVPDVLPKAISAEKVATVRQAFASVSLGWLRRAHELGSGRGSLLAPFVDDADPVVRANALAAEVHMRGSCEGLETRILAVLVDGPPAAMIPILSVLSSAGRPLPTTLATRARVLLLADDVGVRNGALWALTSTGEGHEWQAPLVALSDPDENMRWPAPTYLRRQDTDGPVEVILPALVRATRDESLSVKQGAIRAIVSYGDEAVPYIDHIAEALDVPEGMTHMFAALFIGTHPAASARLVDRLRRMDADPTRGTVEVAWALDAIESRRGPSERLREKLAASKPWPAYRFVTVAGYFDGPSATLDDAFVTALFDAAADERATVRAASTDQLVWVLGLKDDRVRNQLAKAASDPDAIVRLAAARRLATMFEDEHTEDTRAALDALAHDMDADVSAAAAGGS